MRRLFIAALVFVAAAHCSAVFAQTEITRPIRFIVPVVLVATAPLVLVVNAAALVKAGFTPSLYHANPVVGENRPFADKANGVHYFDHLAVLRRAAMPPLLFEAGVIVNREEEVRMRDDVVRRQIGLSVARGIDECMKKDEGGRMKDEGKSNGKDNTHGK